MGPVCECQLSSPDLGGGGLDVQPVHKFKWQKRGNPHKILLQIDIPRQGSSVVEHLVDIQ